MDISLISFASIWNIFQYGEYLMKYNKKDFLTVNGIDKFARIFSYLQCNNSD
jgi:hypothetical protein